MPRYFFHVRVGADGLDTIGTDLPDRETARLEAIRLSGDILKNDPYRVALGEDWYIEVTDDVGVILFQVTFMVVAAPALKPNGQGGSANH